MAIEGISSTQDIFVHVDDDGTMQVFETPGGRGQTAEVEVTYLCPWEARISVYNELFGGFGQLNGMGVPTPGHAYPPSPNLYCDAIGRVQPIGINKQHLRDEIGDAAARRWGWAKSCLIPVTYRPLDYPYGANLDPATQIDPSDPIAGCRQRIEANNSFVVVDKAKMELMDGRFDVDSPPASQTPRNIIESTDGFPANTITFTLEYPRIPRVPWEFLRPFLGKANLLPMWGLPPGHILFAGLSADIQQTFRGPELSASLTFLGNLDLGWNETLDDDGEPKMKAFVKSVGGGPELVKYPFGLADLMLALR